MVVVHYTHFIAYHIHGWGVVREGLNICWVGEKCEVRGFVVACWVVCKGLTNLNKEDKSWNTYLQLFCFAFSK